MKKKIKILLVDTYYTDFLKNFYRLHLQTKKLSYEKLKNQILKTRFGTSDSFSFFLNKLGENATDIIVNDEILQKKWARENKIVVEKKGILSKIQSLPYIYRFLGKPKWIQEIALAQIEKYQPDVVYMQDLSIFNPEILSKIKKQCKLLVGQIASPTPPDIYLKHFDLIITSFPHFVRKFKKMGIASEYQKLAFDSRILEKIKSQKRVYDVVFIGSFTPYHLEGTRMLEEVARHVPVHVWGHGLEFLSPLSPLRRNYHGEAWGKDMYKIFAQSKIVLNRHISVSNGYANNMRLYEATGMGAMVITDKKKNLNSLFKTGREVVEYEDSEDLISKINYYLKNNTERKRIAKAGQLKTLREHTYNVRIKQLIGILQKYV